MIAIMIVLLGSGIATSARRNEQVVVYFQAQSTLNRIDLESNVIEQISNSINNPGFFSHDNKFMAFRDESNVWLAELAPFLMNSIFNNIDKPNWGSVFWTPDDLFLVFSYADRIREGDTLDEANSFIYSIETGDVSDWSWGNCNSIVRNLVTKKIGLKCSSIVLDNTLENQSVVLEWGGQLSNFVAQNYETLVTTIEFPSNFDWVMTSDGEQIVYISASPFSDIYVIEGNQEPEALNLAASSIYSNILAVSPDRTMVAYVVQCNYRGVRGCIQISDLTTKTVLWNYTDIMSVSFPRQLRWSPDNKYVVMLGEDEAHNSSLSTFNVSNGTITEFPIEDSTGDFAIRIE